MKKSLLFSILAIVAAVAIGATIYFVSTSKDSEDAKLKELCTNIDDLAVFYVNVKQLDEKGAFDKHITPENRRLMATAMKAGCDDSAVGAHIASIIEDLNNTGINFDLPIYGCVNKNADVAFIATVADVEKFNKSIEAISYMLEMDDQEPIVIVTEGDTRSFTYEEFAVTYNDTQIAIAPIVNDYDTTIAYAAESLNRSMEQLAIFGQSDMATYVNLEMFIGTIIDSLNRNNDMYREWIAEDDSYAGYWEDSIAQNEKNIAMLESYKKELKENANAVMSLTFNPGSAIVDIKTDLGETLTTQYEDLYLRTSNEHLKYFSNDVLALMNYGINGNNIATMISTLLEDPNFKEMINAEVDSNEFNMIMAIAADVIKSINGDFTIGVEDISGQMAERYNYYWDEYYTKPEFHSIEAACLVDVADKYIISNVGQFGAGIFTREGTDSYSASLEGFDFTICQENNLLFASVNMPFATKERTAAERPWAEKIDNSLSYMILDIDNIMKNDFIKLLSDELKEEMDYDVRDIYQRAVDMVSYSYFVVNDVTTVEFGIIFDDKRTNALEQITNLLLPLAVEEVTNEIF